MNRREFFSSVLAVVAAPLATIGLVKNKRPMEFFYDFDTRTWDGRFDTGESITFNNVWKAIEHYYPHYK